MRLSLSTCSRMRYRTSTGMDGIGSYLALPPDGSRAATGELDARVESARLLDFLLIKVGKKLHYWTLLQMIIMST